MTHSEVERFRLHHVGFVFQGFNLFPALTALEQVQLPLGYRGMRNRESEPLACQALEEVGLSHRSHMRPAQLSGGETARGGCPRVRQVADADLRRRTHQRAGCRERPARDRHPASLRTCA